MKSLALLLAATALTVSTASAQTFKPFDDAKSRCPDCMKDRYDNVKLKTGDVIYAKVVAENPVFYVLERFGELRAVAHDAVAGIDRKIVQNEASKAANRDQVLLLNGVVFSGVVSGGEGIDYYKMVVAPGGYTHQIQKSMIALLFVAGEEKLRSPAFHPTGS
jgi:hypothetical protein